MCLPKPWGPQIWPGGTYKWALPALLSRRANNSLTPLLFPVSLGGFRQPRPFWTSLGDAQAQAYTRHLERYSWRGVRSKTSFQTPSDLHGPRQPGSGHWSQSQSVGGPQGHWFLRDPLQQKQGSKNDLCGLCTDLQYSWPSVLPHITGPGICTRETHFPHEWPSSGLVSTTAGNCGQGAEASLPQPDRSWGSPAAGVRTQTALALCSGCKENVLSFSVVIFMFLIWVLDWFSM